MRKYNQDRGQAGVDGEGTTPQRMSKFILNQMELSEKMWSGEYYWER